MGSVALVRQMIYEKEISEIKLVLLRLKVPFGHILHIYAMQLFNSH